jgi:hypothetical protein
MVSRLSKIGAYESVSANMSRAYDQQTVATITRMGENLPGNVCVLSRLPCEEAGDSVDRWRQFGPSLIGDSMHTVETKVGQAYAIRLHGEVSEMTLPIKLCVVCEEKFELKPDKPGFANRCPKCTAAEVDEESPTPRVYPHERNSRPQVLRKVMRDRL